MIMAEHMKSYGSKSNPKGSGKNASQNTMGTSKKSTGMLNNYSSANHLSIPHTGGGKEAFNGAKNAISHDMPSCKYSKGV